MLVPAELMEPAGSPPTEVATASNVCESIGFVSVPDEPSEAAQRVNRQALTAHRAGNYEESARGFSAALDASPDYSFSVRLEGSMLQGQLTGGSPFELRPTTEPDLFVLPPESLEFLFVRGTDGAVARVMVRKAGDTGNSYSRQLRPSGE